MLWVAPRKLLGAWKVVMTTGYASELPTGNALEAREIRTDLVGEMLARP